MALEAEHGDYDLETGDGPFDGLALLPPWREWTGYRWEWERWGKRFELRPHQTYSEPYGPTSPRSGLPCSWRQAWVEWWECRASGGLWDYETEREMDMANYRRRRAHAREKARADVVRVRGIKRSR